MTAELPLCAECVEVRVPSKRHTYCSACAKQRERRATRRKDDKRLKGCLSCGEPNKGRGRRFCDACSEARAEDVRRAQNEYSNRWREAKRRAAGIPARDLHLDGPEGTKWCGFCSEHRALGDFQVNTKGKLAAYCRPCTKKYACQRRLAREYDLSVEDYDDLLDQQMGRCAICLSPPSPDRVLAVDHDHQTGEVRGLLCTRCNRYMVGASDESPELLRRAANYIERPPARTGEDIGGLSLPDEAQLDDLLSRIIGREA